MIENSFFVYDTSKGFARFIKLNFSENYNIDTCTLRRNMEEFDLEAYNVGFVVINDYDELVDFLHIKMKIKYIFASSNIPEVKLLLTQMQDIFVLDLEKIKKETILDISKNLKQIKLKIF